MSGASRLITVRSAAAVISFVAATVYRKSSPRERMTTSVWRAGITSPVAISVRRRVGSSRKAERSCGGKTPARVSAGSWSGSRNVGVGLGAGGGGGVAGEERWVSRRSFQAKLAERRWLTLGWPEEHGGLAASHMMQVIY